MQLYAIFTNSDGHEIKARIENRFLTKGETHAAFFSCFMGEKRIYRLERILSCKIGFGEYSTYYWKES